MRSTRTMLKPGNLYKLHNHEEYCLECIRILSDDYYSPFSAVVRSTITGWTMYCHGINTYEDGTIDWDYSTNGIFTRKDEKGVLHQI